MGVLPWVDVFRVEKKLLSRREKTAIFCHAKRKRSSLLNVSVLTAINIHCDVSLKKTRPKESHFKRSTFYPPWLLIKLKAPNDSFRKYRAYIYLPSFKLVHNILIIISSILIVGGYVIKCKLRWRESDSLLLCQASTKWALCMRDTILRWEVRINHAWNNSKREIESSLSDAFQSK